MPKQALATHPILEDLASIGEDEVGKVLRSKNEAERMSAFQNLINRLWVVCGVLGVLLALNAYLAFWSGDKADQAVSASLGNREIGWERGAVDCTAQIADLIDGDMSEFKPQDYCYKPEVMAFYRPEVCAVLELDRGDGCGVAVVVPPEDPTTTSLVP